MHTRWTNWLAVSLWTLAMIAGGCAVTLMAVTGELGGGLTASGAGILFIGLTSSLATVGALLAIHRPGNPIGWIFLAAALGNGNSVTAWGYGLYITEAAPGTLPEPTPLFWLGAWGYLIVFMVVPTLGILLFPTGRPPSRRWRPFVWFIGIWLTLAVLREMFHAGPLDPEPGGSYSQFSNPLGIESMTGVFGAIETFTAFASIVAYCGAIASVFARLRVATAVERQQIKWFAYAATIPIIGILLETVLFALTDYSTGDATAGSYVTLLGIAIFPIAIGIAILRHNLYDIDRLINRTLVYTGLTATLGLGFAGSIILLQLILSPFTNGNDLEVAGSTLLVFVLFRPLRDRLQRFVDRRFYRQKYDAQRTLASFGATTRDAVDLDQLAGELASTVSATVQPEHISIWLRARATEEVRS